MTIQFEAFVAQNFIVNLPIVWAASRACGTRPRPGRLALAVALGVVYAVCGCLPGAVWLASLPMRLLASLGMAALLAGGKVAGMPASRRVWRLVRASLFIWLATFFFGGIGLSLVTLMSARGWGVWAVTAAVCGGAAVLALALRLYDPSLAKTAVAVSLGVGHRSFNGEGLIDTGNRLIDSVSGLPVAILSRGAAQRLFPDGIQACETGMRAVPYASLGGEGILWAVRPQWVRIDDQEACEMLIAFSPHEKTAVMPACDVLLPAAAMPVGKSVLRRLKRGRIHAS